MNRFAPAIVAALLVCAGTVLSIELPAVRMRVAPPPGEAAGPEAGAGTEAALSERLFKPYESKEYRLAVGDLVEVSVFGHRDTVFENVPIAPDGKLYYMFMDGIPAAGRTPDDVAGDIAKNVGHLFNDPNVSVLPQRFSANSYMIFGKVERPNVYPIETTLTIRQAIAQAEGLAQGVFRGTTIELASLKDSYLLREGERLPVDFQKLIQENDLSQDIYLRPGDIIYIASGLGANAEIYLLGEVVEQKAIAYSDGMNLVGALAGNALFKGGFNPDADLNRVVIVRGSEEEPELIHVNLNKVFAGKEPNVYLDPGDIVFVPPKKYLFARDLGKSILTTFARTFASEFGAEIVSQALFPGDEDDSDTDISDEVKAINENLVEINEF